MLILGRKQQNLETFGGISVALDKLWGGKSKYLVEVAEMLANKSRDSEVLSIDQTKNTD
jgi:hypothetical protein